MDREVSSSQARRAAGRAFALSMALAAAYVLLRQGLTGGWLGQGPGWIRQDPGWPSVGRAWGLHLGAFALLAAVPLLALAVAKGLGQARHSFLGGDGRGLAALPGWMWAAGLLAAVAVGASVSPDPGMQANYPIPDAAPWSVPKYLAFALSYLIYYVAFEFHYRGYLMPALMKTTGPTAALLLQSIPSTLIHLGLPTLELVGSFPGQLVLGWIAWRCGSFWPVVALHAVAGLSLDLSILLTGS